MTRKNAFMSRKITPKFPVPFGQPHPWAYLSLWRDVAGLTQESVAGELSTTGVTVHRWETGKSPVTVSIYMKLANIYGADDIGMLTFPPGNKDQAKALREAWRILENMPAEARADWLATGRVLKATHSPGKKPT